MDTNAVLDNLRKGKRNMRKQMNRLIDKYHKNMEDFEMEFKEEGVVYKYLNKVFEHMNENRGKFTTVIMESVMRVLSTSQKSTEVDEIKEFSHFISGQILNTSIKLDNNQTNCRYSPEFLRLAIAIWSRSKTASNYLRETSLLMLPSPRQLSNYKKKGRVKNGYNPALYSRFHDEFVTQQTETVYGHLLMDEMKLKSGVYFNSSSLEVCGFESEGGGIQIDSAIRNILKKKRSEKKESDESDKDLKIVSYVNQWRF